MALPQVRVDGALPPGQYRTTSFDEVRTAFPATTARHRAAEPPPMPL